MFRGNTVAKTADLQKYTVSSTSLVLVFNFNISDSQIVYTRWHYRIKKVFQLNKNENKKRQKKAKNIYLRMTCSWPSVSPRCRLCRSSERVRWARPRPEAPHSPPPFWSPRRPCPSPCRAGSTSGTWAKSRPKTLINKPPLYKKWIER